MKLGITGGIGCGKSAVLDAFNALGAAVLSSDAIVRNLLEKDAQVQAEIADYFGAGILKPEGVVDRKLLADRVFKDPEDLAWLEETLHPIVRASWQKFTESHAKALVCIEIPLLYEKKLEKYFDFVVSVSCTDAVANQRLLAKGFSEETIFLRRSQQLPIALKISKSDFNIENNGSLEYLKQQCQLLYQCLSARLGDAT